jgi:hypothetical protein
METHPRPSRIPDRPSRFPPSPSGLLHLPELSIWNQDGVEGADMRAVMPPIATWAVSENIRHSSMRTGPPYAAESATTEVRDETGFAPTFSSSTPVSCFLKG